LYLENPKRFNEDLLYVKIREILLLLLQSKRGDEIAVLLRNLFAERTNTFKASVDAHLYNNISLKELAHLTNMSLSTFKRKFRMVYNDTPANYILLRRLRKAEDLLVVSELSINEISEETGFTSIHQLSKKFREMYGLPPSKYRLNHIDKKLSLTEN
jgi:transcriptional regulator GlxA family with amidase domain